jgi:hypothetical protein
MSISCKRLSRGCRCSPGRVLLYSRHTWSRSASTSRRRSRLPPSIGSGSLPSRPRRPADQPAFRFRPSGRPPHPSQEERTRQLLSAPLRLGGRRTWSQARLIPPREPTGSLTDTNYVRLGRSAPRPGSAPRRWRQARGPSSGVGGSVDARGRVAVGAFRDARPAIASQRVRHAYAIRSTDARSGQTPPRRSLASPRPASSCLHQGQGRRVPTQLCDCAP